MNDELLDEPYDHSRYLATIPSPEPVLDAILGALSTAFCVELIRRAPGKFVAVADGIRLTIEVVPEEKTIRVSGRFNWNGRWNVRVIPQRGDDLKMHLLDDKIEEGITRIEALVQARRAIERQFEAGVKLRLVSRSS